MIKFTDIFIKRPVLATVVSLLILIVGVRSLQLLNVREYPELSNAVITINTPYIGANAELVKGFVTTLLEQEVAAVDGIDYLESTSVHGMSSITAHLELDYDPYQALSQIIAKVNKVRNQLPEGSEDPVIDVSVGSERRAMYISFSSQILAPNQVTDYLIREVQPSIQSLSGIESAEILGARSFAMRIWLDPEKMAALDVSARDVFEVLETNNFLSAVGSAKGTQVSINLSAETNIHSAEQFRELVVKNSAESLVRLKDLAQIDLGAEDYDSEVSFDGQSATFIGISVLPTANPLEVIAQVRDVLPEIEARLPEGLQMKVPYDATEYIRDAIFEVEFTLGLALLIVIIVIFLFLGSIRTMIIPALAMPLSLIGAGFFMLLFGFSINLLTLLAMVLAIGLVVDDAIIIMENIYRHVEEGMPRLDAALQGARELAKAVIATTITLVAVYSPIAFMRGLTGTLFIEFAFTLTGAVVISSIVALTLSPMMCSKILRPSSQEKKLRFVDFLNRLFERLRKIYVRLLRGCLNSLPAVMLFATVVLVSCYFMFIMTKKEMAPTEDKGLILVQGTAAPYTVIDLTSKYAAQVFEKFASFPEMDHVFMIAGGSPGAGAEVGNTVFAGMVLIPWGERKRSQMELTPIVQEEMNKIAGLDTVAFSLPPLPGTSGGLPVQFVLRSTRPPLEIFELSENIVQKAWQSGLFVYVDSDLKYDLPRGNIKIDRDLAGDLGLTMREVGNNLAVMLGENYVNRFSIQDRSYRVIPQVARIKRLNMHQLKDYYLRTPKGEIIPMSTLVELEQTAHPRELKRFEQLNSATISAVPAPGVSLGEALDFFQNKARQMFPKGYSADYAGQSRQYMQEGRALMISFFMALIVIYLVLAAQYESFRDPLIILVSVPMSMSGALMFLTLGFATINIYTQVGLITLISLISKHGILIVEFSNQLQQQGKSKFEAVIEASSIRLRPILMTTFSTVMGIFPLLIATGPGAVSRYHIGLVIISGMLIGTLFTLFVLPSVYLLLGKKHQA